MTNEQDNSGGEQAGAIVVRTGRFGDDKDPNLGADTRFKPGESGNPKGRPKGKTLSATIQEMMNDEGFIDRLHDKVKKRFVQGDGPDPVYQSTPMKAMITIAMIEAMDPSAPPQVRKDARNYLATFGWGTKVDVTSKGERISETPKIVSPIAARESDAATQAEAS